MARANMAREKEKEEEKKLRRGLDDRAKIFIEIIIELHDFTDAGLQDLAAQAGVCVATLYNWKGGTTLKPRIDTLTGVARALGYEIILKKT